MATTNEGGYAADVLVWFQPWYSIDVVTIAAGADLKTGHVLGEVTASGKYVSSAPAAADGSETPVAVLIEDADAASADVTEVRVARRLATVNGTALIYDSTINTAAERQTARDALAAAGIITRF